MTLFLLIDGHIRSCEIVLCLKGEDESSSHDAANNQHPPVMITSVKPTLISSLVFDDGIFPCLPTHTRVIQLK